MSDIEIRRDGVAGRITLNRPEALNALTHAMALEISGALAQWRDDETVQILLIDSVGSKAFCAGGDLAAMYSAAKAGDLDGPRQFWRDEYQMNAEIFDFPKPVVSFLQGFVMGGGVGVGCHASHRIFCESSRVAMPECGIGLIPDVGGSLLLSQAPGRIGEYLAMTTGRMNAADAILAGFGDYFVPEAGWAQLKTRLAETGDLALIDRAIGKAPAGRLNHLRDEIDRSFAGETSADIIRALRGADTPFAADALKLIARNAPLAMAVAVEMIHRTRGHDDIGRALDLEYRYVHRSMEQGDFTEGVRALIIDKDKAPNWAHAAPDAVPAIDLSRMLMPLGAEALKLKGRKT